MWVDLKKYSMLQCIRAGLWLHGAVDKSVTFRFTQLVNPFRHTFLILDQFEPESVTFSFLPFTSKVLQS